MGHTYTKAHFHIVFSTKSRQKLIAKAIQPKLWAYMAGICSNVGIVALAIGGIEDHVHSLVELPPTMSLSKALNLLKSNSSGWMSGQRRGFQLAGRLWRICRKRLKSRHSEEVCSESGGTPSQDDV